MTTIPPRHRRSDGRTPDGQKDRQLVGAYARGPAFSWLQCQHDYTRLYPSIYARGPAAAATENRRTATYDVVRRRTLRTTSYVPAHTHPRTQLVDVKCMVLPAPEHSQTALLTSEYRWNLLLSNEVLVPVSHIHPSHLNDATRREPRSVGKTTMASFYL